VRKKPAWASTDTATAALRQAILPPRLLADAATGPAYLVAAKLDCRAAAVAE
jgi:hypothetical protein